MQGITGIAIAIVVGLVFVIRQVDKFQRCLGVLAPLEEEDDENQDLEKAWGGDVEMKSIPEEEAGEATTTVGRLGSIFGSAAGTIYAMSPSTDRVMSDHHSMFLYSNGKAKGDNGGGELAVTLEGTNLGTSM